MPATFLQQCDHALGNATRDGSLGDPMVEHIRQNRHKHVRHPQVHFVGQTIQSRRLVQADLLQRVADFAFSNHTLAASRSPRGSRQDSYETPGSGDQCSGQRDPESAPERHHVSHDSNAAVARPGPDRNDIPIGEPSHFFTRSRVRLHSFVENSL